MSKIWLRTEHENTKGIHNKQVASMRGCVPRTWVAMPCSFPTTCKSRSHVGVRMVCDVNVKEENARYPDIRVIECEEGSKQ